MKDVWTKKIDKISKPLVIFDLDGTLFDVRYRHLEIFKRFTALTDIQKLFPEQVRTLSRAKINDFQYSIEGTLNALGIDRYSEHSAHFIKNVEQFWFKHFFIDELVTYDQPYHGALECVNFFKNHGVHIVYLSGRDVPNMSRGTLTCLEKFGFPHNGHGVSIILKPAYGLDDLLFKKQAMQTLREEGDVVATFDNEPANVQMFIDSFPDATHIHFDSQYARPLELQGAGLKIVKSFAELGF